MNSLLKATKKYIGAYKKIGKKELIVEAEKCYVYEQYKLAMEICCEILEHQSVYSHEVCARAEELKCLLSYYHKYEVGARERVLDDSDIYWTLRRLDKNNYQIVDSWFILGKYYVQYSQYEDASRCFKRWRQNREDCSGLKALSDMYKRNQYDTDTLYFELLQYYTEYYRGINVKDALVKSAKAAEEYFERYIHERVCQKLEVACRVSSPKVYSDDDFVLPYVIRTYDCANEIRKYAREAKHPTLEGCMMYLSHPEIRLVIEYKTIQAMKREYKECLIRNHLQNERRLVEIQEQDMANRNREYQELTNQIKMYNSQCKDYQNQYLENQKKYQEDSLWYQKKALENQKKAMEDEKKFKREANYKLQQIVWNTNRNIY